MNRDLLQVLACPGCHQRLEVDVDREAEGEIESGTLRCGACGNAYPILRFVPRFVPADNYSNSFGFQWNRFRRTQLDSATGQPISSARFFTQSGWTPQEMTGRLTL